MRSLMDSADYFDGYDLGELEQKSPKPLVILDEWCLVALEGTDPYKAPEARKIRYIILLRFRRIGRSGVFIME